MGIVRWLTVAALALPAGPAAAQEVGFDSGDTAWMITATAVVLMMTIPGVALFYGGMVRKMNVLATIMQSFAICSLVSVLWMAAGYSLAFTEGFGFIGSLDRAFMAGLSLEDAHDLASTVPESVFATFQMTFAIITCALVTGAVADRMKFSALLVFVTLWLLAVYVPVAHWVWGGGFLGEAGVLDFAGGTVVHINAGVSALVLAMFLGKRVGYPAEPMPPHSLTLTLVGAGLLWVGWFGFNAGSNLEANGLTAQALLNTITATAAAALAWAVAERVARGHASLLGAVSGAVAGLVAITPAAGLAGTMGAVLLGAVAGIVCLWAVVALKPMLGYDDSLDVFGVHGVGGIVGALGTAIVAAPALGGFGGEGFAISGQFGVQALAVGIAIVWSAVVAAIALLIVRAVIGLRVSDAAENDGLDLTSHGERAYN